jgi:iron complex transport system substrate-binding protein
MTQPPLRIVSLLASGTELVCALGAGDRLVGRSHECDHPAWVTRLPAVSAPTFDITGESRAIDARVRERLTRGEPLYRIDEALLARLAPDLLITQTHCMVCAVSPADLAHMTAAQAAPDQVAALRGGTLEGILEGFGDVARALGLGAEGDALIAGLRARVERLQAVTAAVPHPTVVCLEWIDPVFAMGNWGPELVEIAGGVSLLGSLGEHSATTPWEAVRAADPDVLVVAPCGFGMERAQSEMHVLEAQPGWRDLRAVKAGRVYVADGNLYFNRSGPSLFDTPEILAEILHPASFPARHRETAWARWPDQGVATTVATTATGR